MAAFQVFNKCRANTLQEISRLLGSCLLSTLVRLISVQFQDEPFYMNESKIDQNQMKWGMTGTELDLGQIGPPDSFHDLYSFLIFLFILLCK